MAWVEISAGYCGHDSLKALEKLVDEGNIKHICLTLGMYFNDGGFLPWVYSLIVDLNEKWMRKGIGEIRLIHDGKNHEKLYCFAKDNVVFSANITILEKYKKKIYRAGKVFKIKYEKP